MTSFDDVSVVILAGGRGSRLKGMFPGVPKPMIPVAGLPFLSWITRWIAAHGPRHFIYSTGHLAPVVEQWVNDGSMPDIVREFYREDEPLGTGGGLMNCLGGSREWLLVANGDSLVTAGLDRLLDLRSKGVDGGLLGVEVDDTSRYGRLQVNGESRLTGFEEKVPGQGLVNGGAYLFRRARLLEQRKNGPHSIEYDIIPLLLAQGADIRVIDTGAAPFIDIGTPETIELAERFVRAHL